ncbi:ribosome maturation factor RimM [Oceanivirga miroungae]|uniref:Ribosome maturation factor RimM n=1 Tax=Oceanivirga miroungae TaxID=1130046 RepID=A0A6I8MC75_9FUSO|nr:ribosome maturation factor RimM [Oceanivirga miroungae]VWL85061.1 16S rRNA processing protein RimM [Oceanivirga miroungae]
MVNIGKITRTHNLNGAVKVNSSFIRIKDLIGEKVLVENEKDTKILSIKNVKTVNEKMHILSFVEIKDINEAKDLIGFNIKIRDDLMPEINEDELYVEDLISFKVYDKNTYIGDVVDVLETAAHDILTVVDKDREVLIPYVEDVFIKNIDIKEKKIEVNLLEGML